MKIDPISMSEQMRMIRGVEGVTPKSDIHIGEGVNESDGKKSFLDFLEKSVSEVNTLGNESEKSMQRAILKEEPFPHTTVIALQKADLSFQLLLSVQRKIVEAYREVLRTPIG